jgi:hypothetical protein
MSLSNQFNDTLAIILGVVSPRESKRSHAKCHWELIKIIQGLPRRIGNDLGELSELTKIIEEIVE